MKGKYLERKEIYPLRHMRCYLLLLELPLAGLADRLVRVVSCIGMSAKCLILLACRTWLKEGLEREAPNVNRDGLGEALAFMIFLRAGLSALAC